MDKLTVLRSARKLLSDPKRWGRTSLEKQRDGETCYCALGAIGAAAGLNLQTSEGRHMIYGEHVPSNDTELVAKEAVQALAAQVPGFSYLSASDKVWHWNDATTYENVMAVFSKACEAEFAAEQEVAVA